MAIIDLSTITIPSPEAYNADDPLKQIENLCYVILQILAVAKSAGITFDDALVSAVSALQNNEQEIDLNGQKIRWGTRSFFYDHL